MPFSRYQNLTAEDYLKPPNYHVIIEQIKENGFKSVQNYGQTPEDLAHEYYDDFSLYWVIAYATCYVYDLIDIFDDNFDFNFTDSGNGSQEIINDKRPVEWIIPHIDVDLLKGEI